MMQVIPNTESRAYHIAWNWEGRPEVSEQIHATVSKPIYRPTVANLLKRVPSRYHGDLLTEYSARGGDSPTRETNVWLRDAIATAFGGKGLSLAASDEEISQYAESRVSLVNSILERASLSMPEEVIGWLQGLCDRNGVNLPQRKTLAGTIARMTDPRWWRRSLRRELMKKREAGAIKAGFVHRRKALYVSDEAMYRYQQSAKRSQQWLESMEVINEDTGEVIDLADAAKGNVSNPTMRRAEMMTRIKGEEEAAKQSGYEALFLTWTCPSRMHARMSKSGQPNQKYDGTEPGKAHQYLCKQFSKARAKNSREGLRLFGLRVVEPHHDGTPHWHLLVFVHKSDRRQLIANLRHYALEHDGDEPGAAKTRFTVKLIDPKKGSAVGYVAKYVSKNLDGESVGLDFEADGDNASNTCSRVLVWSKTWRIRQFQFFGDSPVTIWRELRRLRDTAHIPEIFKPYWIPADAGEWQSYMKAMQATPIRLWTEDVPSRRYPDEMITVVRGVELDGQRLETRPYTWSLRQKAAHSAPWTCVNNCTRQGRGNAPPSSESGVFRGRSDLVYQGDPGKLQMNA